MAGNRVQAVARFRRPRHGCHATRRSPRSPRRLSSADTCRSRGSVSCRLQRLATWVLASRPTPLACVPRYALAVWFAVGTRRAVRRMTRPARPSRLRARANRAAALAGVVAAVLLPTSLMLDLTLGASASPDSLRRRRYSGWPCSASRREWSVPCSCRPGLAGAATRLRPRPRRPPAAPPRPAPGNSSPPAGVSLARLRARPARIAAVAFFAAIISITTAIVAGTTTQGQFYGHGILARFADVAGITGLACTALAICLALVAVTARLWLRRARH